MGSNKTGPAAKPWLALAVACAVAGAGVLVRPDPAGAEIPEVAEAKQSGSSQSGAMERLRDPKHAQDTISALVNRKDVAALANIARSDVDTVARGWAIVGLSQVSDTEADAVLQEISIGAAEYPELVRTWASAARIQRAENVNEARQILAEHPSAALQRPLQLKLESMVADAPTVELVRMSMDYNLAAAAAAALKSRDLRELVDLVYDHPEDAIRRQATALAGGIASQDPASGLDAMIRAKIQFNRNRAIPWEGGALYIPGIARDREASRAMLHELFAWWLSLTTQGRASEAQQVWNNLYGIQILNGAGYPMDFSAEPRSVVDAVRRQEGRAEARRLVARVGLEGDARFAEEGR